MYTYTEVTQEAIDALPGVEALTDEQKAEIWPLEGQAQVLYKVVGPYMGTTHTSSSRLKQYSPPDDFGNPGEWTLIHENPTMCSHGVHVTADPLAWFSGYNFSGRNRIFEVEAKNIILTHDGDYHHDPSNKVVTSTIRLLRELDLGDMNDESEPTEDHATILGIHNRLKAIYEERLEEKRLKWEAERAEREAKEEEERKQRQIEAQKKRVEQMARAAAEGKIYVSQDSNARTVLGNAMRHLTCPYCENRLEGFRRKVEISESGYRTDYYEMDTDGDVEEIMGDTEWTDSETTEEELEYKCCEHRVEADDFEDLFYFDTSSNGNIWYGRIGDFEDLVRVALQG